MQKLKLFFKQNAIAILIFLGLVAALISVASMLIEQTNQNKVLLTQAIELNAKIEAMTNELGSAKTEAELAKKEPDELKAKIAELTNDNAAFAVQAKACNEIKKKYHLK